MFFLRETCWFFENFQNPRISGPFILDLFWKSRSRGSLILKFFKTLQLWVITKTPLWCCLEGWWLRDKAPVSYHKSPKFKLASRQGKVQSCPLHHRASLGYFGYYQKLFSKVCCCVLRKKTTHTPQCCLSMFVLLDATPKEVPNGAECCSNTIISYLSKFVCF